MRSLRLLLQRLQRLRLPRCMRALTKRPSYRTLSMKLMTGKLVFLTQLLANRHAKLRANCRILPDDGRYRLKMMTASSARVRLRRSGRARRAHHDSRLDTGLKGRARRRHCGRLWARKDITTREACLRQTTEGARFLGRRELCIANSSLGRDGARDPGK